MIKFGDVHNLVLSQENPILKEWKIRQDAGQVLSSESPRKDPNQNFIHHHVCSVIVARKNNSYDAPFGILYCSDLFPRAAAAAVANIDFIKITTAIPFSSTQHHEQLLPIFAKHVYY
jgi:hypothetical protein